MASTQEQRIDRTISGAMDQIDRLQKVFRDNGKLANAIAEVGGDVSFSEIQAAFDSLYDSLESAHYDALGHLGVDENIEEGRMSDQIIHDSETMSKEEFIKKYGKEMADEYYESVQEAAKPDFADIDGDGDEEESMKKAAKDKKEKEEAKESLDYLKKLAGITESDDEDNDDEEEEDENS